MKKPAVRGIFRVFQVIRGGVVFELQIEPEGGYTISVPSLPGCISYGETFEEAIDMIKDVMAGWRWLRKKVYPFQNSLRLSSWRRFS